MHRFVDDRASRFVHIGVRTRWIVSLKHSPASKNRVPRYKSLMQLTEGKWLRFLKCTAPPPGNASMPAQIYRESVRPIPITLAGVFSLSPGIQPARPRYPDDVIRTCRHDHLPCNRFTSCHHVMTRHHSVMSRPVTMTHNCCMARRSVAMWCRFMACHPARS